MKQLIMSSDKAMVTRVPRVHVEAGSVLVEVHYSLVSTGTELASLKEHYRSADQNTLEKAEELSSRAVHYLGKAINDPAKAAKRLRDIAATRLRKLSEMASKPATIVSVPLSTLSWAKVGDGEFSSTAQGFTITSDSSAAGYQIISRPIAVAELETPEADGGLRHILEVSIRGVINDVPYTLGLLNADQSAWISQANLSVGKVNEVLQFACLDSDVVHLVVANGGTGGGRMELEELSISLSATEDDGLPVSELDAIGWGLGYSVAGEIIGIGQGVRGFKVGDYVACAGAGQANHAEVVCVKQNLVAPVPIGVSLQQAATATVGAIAMQGVRRTSPELGEVVCVVGLGLIGMMTVQILRAAGCTVIGLDLDPTRIERVRKLGVTLATTSFESCFRMCMDASMGYGADATVVTAAAPGGHHEIINNAMKTTRRRGRVVVVGDVGLHLERPDFYRKELDLLMSTSYGPGRYDNSYELAGHDYPYAYVRWTENRNMRAFLELIARNQLNVDELIDLVVPLEAAPEAYESLAHSKTPPMGVIIEYAVDGADRILNDSTTISIRGARTQRGEQVRYALVGAGAFGTSMLVPQLDKFSDVFQLESVCSRDPVRGGNFARQRGVAKLSSRFEDVLADESIELVVIATQHQEHAQQVAEALKAGKHVFVEKPLATTWDELDLVQQAYARTSDQILMVGFNRGFAPAIEVVKQRFANRSSPLMVNYRINGGYIPKDSWIQDRRGAGRNIGEACHMYDLFAQLADAELTNVQVQSITSGKSQYLENDNFFATTKYRDGSACQLTYTALGPKGGLPKERIEVFCGGECVVIDDFVSCVSYPSEEVLWEGDVADKGHFREIELLAQAVRTGDVQRLPSVERIFETSAVALYVEDLINGQEMSGPLLD